MTVLQLVELLPLIFELIQADDAVLALEVTIKRYLQHLCLQLPSKLPWVVLHQYNPDQKEDAKHDGSDDRVHVQQSVETEVVGLHSFLVLAQFMKNEKVFTMVSCRQCIESFLADGESHAGDEAIEEGNEYVDVEVLKEEEGDEHHDEEDMSQHEVLELNEGPLLQTLGVV